MHDSEVVQQSMTCCLYLIVGPADGHRGGSFDGFYRGQATGHDGAPYYIPRGPEPITIMMYTQDSSWHRRSSFTDEPSYG